MSSKQVWYILIILINSTSRDVYIFSPQITIRVLVHLKDEFTTNLCLRKVLSYFQKISFCFFFDFWIHFLVRFLVQWKTFLGNSSPSHRLARIDPKMKNFSKFVQEHFKQWLICADCCDLNQNHIFWWFFFVAKFN